MAQATTGNLSPPLSTPAGGPRDMALERLPSVTSQCKFSKLGSRDGFHFSYRNLRDVVFLCGFKCLLSQGFVSCAHEGPQQAIPLRFETSCNVVDFALHCQSGTLLPEALA